MNNIISNNAYGILGLLPNASQKEISRRVKEIEKYLQIDENPQYDFDFGYYNNSRTLQSVHDAFFNISNINNQIMHHFFRVYASDEQQLDNLNYIADNFDSGAISSVYHSNQSKNLIIDKNIAISLTLLLIKGIDENIEFLSNACIDLWHSILVNEKYLKDYKKVFLLDDEVGIEDSLLDDLKDSIIKELTQVFSDISKQYCDNQILSRFIDKFQLNDNIFNLDTVEEIYNNIHKTIKIMDSMNISEDGIFDDNEKRTLKECLQTFQDEFNKLIELGLYDNEKTIILRDLVATKIRIQILDLFNNLDEDSVALNLMRFSLYIVGTEGLKEKLMDELNVIKKYNNPLDTITINKNTTLKLYNKYIKINEKQISFDEIQSVSFLLHTTRTNGFETERTYYFDLGTEDDLYNLTQNTGMFTNKKEAENNYYKLINFANFIIPIISEKLYNTLMCDKTLRMDTLYLRKDCYYIRKWNGDKYVRISKKLPKPVIKEGEVYLFDENGYEFFKCSLNLSNANVLYDLVTKLIESNDNCKKREVFSICPLYSLHIFNPEEETEEQRKKVYRDDFFSDLTSWIGAAIGFAFIGGFIYMLISGK